MSRGNRGYYFDTRDTNWSHYKQCCVPKLNATYFLNERGVITLTGSFLLPAMLETNYILCHVLMRRYANTLCTCCPANKLPYRVLQLLLQSGRPIHLSNEMIWKLWIMAIFQSKRNKPLIAMWPLGNFKKESRKRSSIGGEIAYFCSCFILVSNNRHY